ncbi:hypothetical protein ACMYSL_12615 [Klebsiella sp. MISC125]|uniref:hypothetical protein n=1 Tax=Klebsiella sp. MISC125 TaxID=2755386 RepID=UPI003DA8D710
MKALSFYDRIMLNPYLRPVTLTLCVLFCIAVWGVGIHYSLKMIELLLTLFKGA